jgi:hypothetical protein
MGSRMVLKAIEMVKNNFFGGYVDVPFLSSPSTIPSHPIPSHPIISITDNGSGSDAISSPLAATPHPYPYFYYLWQ